MRGREGGGGGGEIEQVETVGRDGDIDSEVIAENKEA